MAIKYDKYLEDEIVKMYNNGISPYKMVDIIPELKGKRPSVIYGVLKRLGIESHRKCPLTEKQKLNRRKYNVNDNYFEIIDSEQKAYWLGFIYADGFLNTNENVIGITLSIQDKQHLENFKSHIEFTGEIKEYEFKDSFSPGKMYARIIIRSSKMKSDLIKLGVVENKTNVLKFPTTNQVPQKYIYDFIRGYIDGDGSITYGSKLKSGNNYTIKITGTKEILTGIQNIFNLNLKLEQRHPGRKVNNYSFTIGGNKQVNKILDSIYKNATIYLTRKYNRYLELKKQQAVVHGQVLQKTMND